MTVGLNNGEARHALARAVFFHRCGAVSDRIRSEQANKAKRAHVHYSRYRPLEHRVPAESSAQAGRPQLAYA